ncbi:MAG: 30S ribosomal protein S17 [Candidatus Magasanikbacteria bacterium GW2011_GWD2_43_18]|uniref:Small ribosomal subunit protein uS17 n=1 Tax=Candidatus Magasanikbacteria bacterium GW2011_GWE2_42_7 TaxID=1619052 RepID=A0A0G1DJU7_9BACT|nr:MAG: 30S ribosomal protein S17 [Candidatus Magasanikbacteria bacterium GW2011_GWC2_42_27]KKS71111.1 MAG: 30S ribosomal protein S17 [Candidatus Magasanikbacteria bacterium GW2011_GWE2_42_7]KKT04294.1 MAG: 30S ribosomal protein S17 [Candidatus Magasanikbacteria bacterium GW2011_GWD2_43_18]KKT24869.1 MAG: 30S ribosomal protein S17 [Candidatus Magasanikbacteria bacterium GW2011_GWA2_43_9]HBB38362.1 30S ribosomal protein S17 [Candidatus Magasanikbacteria bacterium]
MTTKNHTTQTPKVIKREFEGTVVSAKEQKTVHVRVETVKMHPKYKKQYVTSRKYAVHDEKGTVQEGDVVRFQECRPYSKTKRWFVISVVKKTA